MISNQHVESAAAKRFLSKEALAACLVSFVVWAAWEMVRPGVHPFGDLQNGIYSDHVAHMNIARVFPKAGLELWRTPIREIFPALTAEETAALPSDVRVGGSETGGIYRVPGWPRNKPLVANWTLQPRLYPPGELLLFAPAALLYHFTDIPARWMNRLLIVFCLALAHAAFFFFIRTYLSNAERNGPVDVLVLFLFWSNAVYCSLNGFYDMAAVIPLLLCGCYLVERRGAAAITAFCAAAALHFRAFFFAPLLIMALWMVIRDRQWKTWRAPQFTMMTVSMIMGAASLCTFFLVWPSFIEQEVNNIIRLDDSSGGAPALTVFLIIWSIAAAIFVRARAWIDLIILIWFAVMLTGIRQTFEWHICIPLVWLGLPVFFAEAQRVPLVRGVRVFAFLFMSVFIFRNTLMPVWLITVFK
jgi:hypothetical protein